MKYRRFWGYMALTALAGFLGFHRFASGKSWTGLLYLFTFGLLGMGPLYDGIMLSAGKFKDRKGVPVPSPFESKPFAGTMMGCPALAAAVVLAALFLPPVLGHGNVPGSVPASSPSPSLAATPTPTHTPTPTLSPLPTPSPAHTPSPSPALHFTALAFTPAPTPTGSETLTVEFTGTEKAGGADIARAWKFRVDVNGRKLAAGGCAIVHLNPYDELRLTFTAVGDDPSPQANDTASVLNSIRADLLPDDGVFRDYSIVVTVYEDGEEGNPHEEWRFNIRIKRE